MSLSVPKFSDVIVIGGGNAAFCAALSARESGASVLMLERAPEDEAGGNTRFTAGAMRCVYDGVDDLRRLMPDTDPLTGLNNLVDGVKELQKVLSNPDITSYRVVLNPEKMVVREGARALTYLSLKLIGA